MVHSRGNGRRSQRKSERDPAIGLEHRLRQVLAQGTGSQRKLADFALRNPIRVAASSIEDLGRVVGVSAPTISRFARELGFSGFAEMRAAIAEATQELMDPVTKLRERMQEDTQTDPAAEAFDVLRKQLALVDLDELGMAAQRIAAKICQARTVYVVGFGLSAFAGGMLATWLAPFHRSVVSVVGFGGTELAISSFSRITPGDLMVAITVPRYTPDVVRLAELARERGVEVAVLTDSMASPLAGLADELALVPCTHPILPNSVTGIVALCETIVSAVMLADPENPDRARRLAETLAHHMVRDRR